MAVFMITDAGLTQGDVLPSARSILCLHKLQGRVKPLAQHVQQTLLVYIPA